MAMDKSAADSYSFAKASGMLSRSYIGKRAEVLFSMHSLSDLWSLLFKKELPQVPEMMLAECLQQEAFDSLMEQLKKILPNYDCPPQTLLSLLQAYEYENLKQLGASLCMKETKCPKLYNIQPYSIIDYSKWPQIDQMTQNTFFEWYNRAPKLEEQREFDYRLDCQYVQNLWKTLDSTDRSCKTAMKKFIGGKIIFDNILWALRLKIYYKMDKEEILKNLAYSTQEKKAGDLFVKEAEKILDWSLDDYEKWSTWTYARFINPRDEKPVWQLDPRYMTNSYKNYYVKEAYRLFRLFPFTQAPLICWFILKRNELDNIRTATECLRLNIDSNQALELAGLR